MFVFARYGKIVAMAVNGPGVLHDSYMAKIGDLYGKLESMFIKHFVSCVLDSAVANKSNNFPIQSAQTLPRTEDASDHLLFLEATAVIQLSECVMHALQGSFPHIEDMMRRGEKGYYF